jgi:hypothetical protein
MGKETQFARSEVAPVVAQMQARDQEITLVSQLV